MYLNLKILFSNFAHVFKVHDAKLSSWCVFCKSSSSGQFWLFYSTVHDADLSFQSSFAYFSPTNQTINSFALVCDADFLKFFGPIDFLCTFMWFHSSLFSYYKPEHAYLLKTWKITKKFSQPMISVKRQNYTKTPKHYQFIL